MHLSRPCAILPRYVPTSPLHALRRCIYPVDLNQRGVQMLEWPFPASMSRMDSVQPVARELDRPESGVVRLWGCFSFANLSPAETSQPAIIPIVNCLCSPCVKINEHLFSTTNKARREMMLEEENEFIMLRIESEFCIQVLFEISKEWTFRNNPW